MPYGAHEAVETHEILLEKMNMINHFSVYQNQCQDMTLRQMIQQHMQKALDAYNHLVAYTHDYVSANAVPSSMQPSAQPQPIQYGLNQPLPEAPQVGITHLTDRQIAEAVLAAHKNSAKNHMAAAVECADAQVRQMMVNGAITCSQQAYEIFLFMNQNGLYQVPVLNNHTAKTYLHRFQPVGQPAAVANPVAGHAHVGSMPQQQPPLPM